FCGACGTSPPSTARKWSPGLWRITRCDCSTSTQSGSTRWTAVISTPSRSNSAAGRSASRPSRRPSPSRATRSRTSSNPTSFSRVSCSARPVDVSSPRTRSGILASPNPNARRRSRACSRTNKTVTSRAFSIAGPRFAEPHPLSRRHRRAGRAGLCRPVRAGELRQGEAARDHPDDPVAEGRQMTGPASRIVVGFLDALASERGASANTLEAYRRDLSDYEGHLSAQGTDALNAGAKHVEAYLCSRGADGLSAASLARRLSAVRQFHKHLYAEGHRRDDPTLPIDGPRRARPLPKVLTVED